MPALFQRTSSLGSWDAKVVAAALTDRRSLRSRWRNLSLPSVFELEEFSVMALIAASALTYLIIRKAEVKKRSWEESPAWFLDAMYMVAPLEYRILHSSNPIPAFPPVTINTRPFSEPGGTFASVNVGACDGHVWFMELRRRSNMICIL